MRGEGYSLSDIAAATGNQNNGGFGGNGDWAWIIVLFLIFGWGRNGNGFGGNGGSGATDNYVLTSDFSQLSRQISDSTVMTERKLDSITNGLCTLGYDNLVQTNAINSNINTLGMTLQNCCCDLRQQISDTSCVTQRAIDGVNYNLATNTCTITNAINNGIRDVMQNCNNNYNKLHEEILNNRMEDLKETNRLLRDRNSSLELRASQNAQSDYILNALRTGCPVNAQLVCGNQPIPVQYIGAGCNGFNGYNGGCGC